MTKNEKARGHAVKIIGWGVEKRTNVSYWLIANTWGSHWGEHGHFKMVRGENHLGIEQNVIAGLLPSNVSATYDNYYQIDESA
ncbi:unnamed protein product [Strongylus vulgaris]|uniref:Peptidase C1A papain C-terminal domain-containing protein n=1 Tax=Strongylus vulgaris TaxID=40348 RepID=A0A3P7JEP7_STRVU|nr:unnamed protein product [Strongylus vulgaris]